MKNIRSSSDQRLAGDEDGETLPGERLPGESNRAFMCFCVYRDLGPGRSLEAAAQLLGKSRQILHKYSAMHHWVSRTKTYDTAIDVARTKARLREAAIEGAKTAARWEKRKQEALEEFFLTSIELKRAGDLMLRCPIAKEVKGEDGSLVLEPSGRWAFRDAATLLRTAIEVRTAVIEAASRSLDGLSEIELRVLAGLDDVPALDPAGSTDETAKSSTPDPTN